MPAVAKISALRRGEAGRAGDDVRSDLHVSFEERNSGGVEIGQLADLPGAAETA